MCLPQVAGVQWSKNSGGPRPTSRPRLSLCNGGPRPNSEGSKGPQSPAAHGRGSNGPKQLETPAATGGRLVQIQRRPPA